MHPIAPMRQGHEDAKAAKIHTMAPYALADAGMPRDEECHVSP